MFKAISDHLICLIAGSTTEKHIIFQTLSFLFLIKMNYYDRYTVFNTIDTSLKYFKYVRLKSKCYHMVLKLGLITPKE